MAVTRVLLVLQLLLSPKNTFSDILSDETKYVDTFENSTVLICSICDCPSDRLSNPYIIDCESRQLEVVPIWDEYLVSSTQVNNVHVKFNYNYFQNVLQLRESSSVDAIYIESNAISGIDPFAFAYLPRLKLLSLSNNQLHSLHPNAFSPRLGSSVSSLEVLDLSFNQLSHLDLDIFDELGNLAELNLRGNPFGVINAASQMALLSLTGLTRLSMADTGLAEVPQKLEKLVQHLEDVDLQSNRLPQVPEVLHSGEKLCRLMLDGNHIRSFDKYSFKQMKSLRVLSISYMEFLENIGTGTFSYLDNLEILQCHHNTRLSVFHDRAFNSHSKHGPKKLQLDLNNNNLSYIGENLLKNIQVTSLDVSNNSFFCNCHLAWLKNYPQDNPARCATPVLLSGRLILEVDFEDRQLVPCEESGMETIKMLIAAIPPINRALGIGLLTVTFFLIFLILLIGILLIRNKCNLRCKKALVKKKVKNENSSVPYSTPKVMYTQLQDFCNDSYDMDLWDN